MDPSAEPSTGLADVTMTPLGQLRRHPTSLQAEQSQRMIDELLVAIPPAQEQTQEGLFTTVYRNTVYRNN